MADRWYIAKDGSDGPRQFGPMSSVQLRQLLAAGKLLRDDLVYQEGAQSWVPVGTVPHFFPPARPAIQPALPALPATDSVPMQLAPQPMPAAATPLLGPSSTARNIVLILGGGILALLLVCAGIVTLALFVGRGSSGPAGPPRAPTVVLPSAQPGTITFAEFVDSRTFATRNEGREFSTGWVWILVRSGKPFGDTRMVISYRESDSAVSTVLTEAAIDPNWDSAADRIRLILPGTYVITATNSRGELIAQDVVRIVY